MAEPAHAASGNPENFASLLAPLTDAAKADDSWDDAALAEDVADISYEQALRSVRRAGLNALAESSPAPKAHAPTPLPAPSIQKKRRTASITIRVSEAEQAQLHERAAAAKLSVSVYLRSCIFEAEALRAQVKEALAQMQAAGSDAHQLPNAPRTSPHRRFLFLPWKHKRGA